MGHKARHIHTVWGRTALLPLLLCLALLLLPPAARAQRKKKDLPPPPPPAESPFLHRLKDYFSALGRIPKEKVYVHIDKPLYNAGDSLWFRGYLVDGMMYARPAVSNFLYIELFNSADSLILRRKIGRDTLGGFANALPLPSSLAEGEYSLRAWSTWMQNFPTDYFFERKLYITNSLLPEDGTAAGGPSDTPEGGRAGAPKGRASRGQKGSQETAPAFQVKFFPEGGPLLQGVMQKIAFSVTGPDGRPVEAQGRVYCTDSLSGTEEEVLSLATQHMGMGQMLLMTTPGVRYEARMQTESGLEGRFPLPEVCAQGITLNMSQYKDKIRYQIQRTPGLDFADSLFLVVQSRGLLLQCVPLPPQDKGGILDASSLPEGVIHFLLVAQGRNTPLAERLMLVQHPQLQDWSREGEALEPKPRKRVELALKGLSPEPLAGGSFSVSVTQRALVTPDSLEANIRSSLLLESELRGPIYHPGYYVGNGESPGKALYTDLLLLCHGWRKYADFDFQQPAPKVEQKFFIERGQYIDGYTQNLLGKPLTEGDLVAIALNPLIMRTATLDENGEFLFENLSFPDSTVFVIQARNKRGKSNMTLVANEQVFPPAGAKTPTSTALRSVSEDFLHQSKEKYYLDGGMPTYELEAIAVTAESGSRSIYAHMADRSYSGSDLDRFRSLSVLDFLRQVPYMEVMPESVNFMGEEAPPVLYIDDFPYFGEFMMDELERIHLDNVESIDFFRKTNTVIFGPEAAHGVISLMLKDGIMGNIDTRPLGVINFAPLGYAKPVAFSHPQYATAAQFNAPRTDIRTTVYWNPHAVFDADGCLRLQFYLPDNPGALHLELEGIDAAGTPCRYCTDL